MGERDFADNQEKFIARRPQSSFFPAALHLVTKSLDAGMVVIMAGEGSVGAR